MKIAFYGGSFNPPHRGHLNSAIAAAEQLCPDLFFVIPDCRPPHKTLEAGSPTPEERMELCRLNFAEVPNAEVSDLEIARGGKSYTVDTVRALQRLYPDAELVMLVGTDLLLDDGYHTFIGVSSGHESLYESIGGDGADRYEGTIKGLETGLISATKHRGNQASVSLGGVEYALNQRGLNIVVYDPETSFVIDSVAFDTQSDGGVTCIR